MANLIINGQKVTVDDSFLKLSPDQQAADVDEIAKQMGAAPRAAPSGAPQPGTPEYAAQFVARQAAGQAQPQPATPPPEWQPQDVMPAPLRAFSNHAVESVPVLGGLLHSATASPMNDAIAQSADAQAPGAAAAGDVFGTVAPFAIGGAIPSVAKVLGMSSDIPGILGLAARTGASAGSNAAIAGADSLTRGKSLPEALQDAVTGGAVGAVLPGVGDLIGKGASVLGNKVGQAVNALTNTDRAAQRVVSGAAAADTRAGQALDAAGEASAAVNGQPIVNADRFGGNVRTLARTAKNIAPDAGAALDDLTQQRFKTQSDRATQFVRRITGGTTDDLALQDQMTNAARLSNGRAYRAAEAAPGAQAIWTPQIRQLMQSPDVLSAIHGATATAANDAALSGQKAVRNPFAFDAKNNVLLRRNPDGSTALPSLQFWDIVQRNLRRSAEAAYGKGQKDVGSQIAQLRKQLLSALDTAVPQFARARAGAAAAFGAEDALDAGRKFVTQPMGIPEARQAYAKFTAPEKKAFATGFASSLIDKIGAARDGVNVINHVFGSPATRAQVEMALGKNAAAQLEHFVRVEDIMQMTKQAVQGNSSTAKQLIAAGVVGGGIGGAFGGWDPRNIASGAFLLTAGRAGMRALGKSVDQKVMQRVAEILSSGDQAAINKEILNATISREHAGAIRAIEQGLQVLSRAGDLAATRSQQPSDYSQPAGPGGPMRPLQITVRGATAQ